LQSWLSNYTTNCYPTKGVDQWVCMYGVDWFATPCDI